MKYQLTIDLETKEELDKEDLQHLVGDVVSPLRKDIIRFVSMVSADDAICLEWNKTGHITFEKPGSPSEFSY